MSWKRLKRTTLHTSPHMTMWIDDVELPNGQFISYSGATLPDGIMVVATNPEGNLLVFDEYKYAMDETILLIPAGGKDGPEDAVAAAKRELIEETGYTSDEFEFIVNHVPYPSKIIQTGAVVHARNVRKVADHEHEDTEEISNMRFVSPKEFRELISGDKPQLVSVIAAVAVAAPEFIAATD